MTTFVYIMGILFWVLLALAVLSLVSWSYTQLVYLKWSREDREREFIEDVVNDVINSEQSESEGENGI